MTWHRMVLILGAIVVIGASAIGGQFLLVQRQTRLQNTITDQRAIICELATDLFDLLAEVHPVLAVVNPRVGAPVPPKPQPPPVQCQLGKHRP